MPLNVYANFDEKPYYHLGDRARTHGRMDAQTDGLTDGLTDGRTERCFQYTPLPYGRA